MGILNEYDRFKSQMNNYRLSTRIINDALKECVNHNSREVNLAKSIHVKYNYIGILEIFKDYLLSVIIEILDNHIYWDKVISFCEKKKEKTITLQMKDLFLSKDNKELIKKIILKEFKTRKPKIFIENLENLLLIGIPKDLRENASFFWDVRNIFTHANGKVNDEWRQKYSYILLKNGIKLKEKSGISYFPTNFRNLSKAYKTFDEFCSFINSKLKTPTKAGV